MMRGPPKAAPQDTLSSGLFLISFYLGQMFTEMKPAVSN